jgi:hypothetical protein
MGQNSALQATLRIAGGRDELEEMVGFGYGFIPLAGRPAILRGNQDERDKRGHDAKPLLANQPLLQNEPGQ